MSEIEKVDDLVSIAEIANRLCVTAQAIKVFCARYEIKMYKIGQAIYVDKESDKFDIFKNGRFIFHPVMMNKAIVTETKNIGE